MRLSSYLVDLVGVSLCLVAGCANTHAEEGADTSTGAATSAATKIASGIYDDELHIVVQGTHIEASYFSQVGDPDHGGAQCYFTMAGFIENVGGVEHGHVTAVDGFGATAGEIIADANGSVRFSTVNSLSACMRTSPELTNGFSLSKSASIGGIAGFRTAQKDKAFFYDTAGGNPRTAYVMQGDTVEVTGAEQNGFIPVQYVGSTTTKGFLKTADLAAQHAPVPHDTLRAAFDIKPNDGISSGFEVITSDNRDMFFNLTAVNKFGGNNMGDIEMGHAKLVGDTATYQGDSCTITFAFSADAKTVKVNQDGQCGDFGANVLVSGDYDRK
jgi:hypothetical protein